MHIWSELGAGIEEAFRRVDYDEARFPAIAAGALRDAKLERAISHTDVLRWLLSAPELPPQDDLEGSFGHPPLTVYHGRRFFIQVIFWLEGTTSIHRHGFSGAFLVLDGAGLHTRYCFTPTRRVSSRFLIGDLRLEKAELLGRGDIVEITKDLIHAHFHLDIPAATVVVRTYHEDEATPQYDYRRPCLAIDPFYRDPVMTRKLQGLCFARNTQDERSYLALAAEVVAASDLHTAFAVLEQAQRGPGDPGRMAPLVSAAAVRHGAVVEALAAALREDLRARKLQRLRKGVKDAGLRFFLALLSSLPHRAAIDGVVRRRYPGARPREKLAVWARGLSGVEKIGVVLDDELNSQLFEALLDGCTSAEVLERLKRDFDPADVDAQADAISRHAERLRESALLPLFREGEVRAKIG